MATNIYPTLREIRDTHAWKRDYERYLPLSRYVFRPLGFLLTWLAIRIGLTSEAVSWLSGFIGLIAYLCLISSQEYLLLVGIALLCFFNILDCVDGSIARTMKTENPYGRFLDSLMNWVDMGFWALIGIVVYRHEQLVYFSGPIEYSPVFWLAAGGVTSYFFILLGYIESTFDQYVRDEWKGIGAKNDTDLKNKTKDKKTSHSFHREIPPFSVVRIIGHNIKVRETHYFLLILAYLCKAIDLLLVFYLFYYFLNTIFLIIIYSNRGRQLLKSYNA
ncbi:MAG: CDP-alcohol phosphatidyltransferase family protein [Candidatus Scalindua sp.]|nr:CDP-alcohol phosphatidyltransferase family protein [Candidatus Scalindua sp.]